MSTSGSQRYSILIMKIFYYVYILKSLKDKKFYIGFTRDLKRRIKEHEAGENKSTASRCPFELIFFEAYLSK